MRTISVEVKEPIKLKEFIEKVFPDYSNTKRKEILSHRVVVSSRRITQYDFPLAPGMMVTFEGDENRDKMMFGRMPIVFEDKYLIVVDKPVGLLSSSGHPNDITVITELNEYLIRRRSRQRAHVVHRLDRETSGLLMVSKSKEVSMMLERDWKGTVYERSYVGVTWGVPIPYNGTIKTWLTDGEYCVESSDVDNGGKLAITHYKLLRRNQKYALVQFNLETGRRNQIRVHMKAIGHPLLKDPLYGYENDRSPMKRMALHANKLCFHHPVTGKDISLESTVPDTFIRLFGTNG